MLNRLLRDLPLFVEVAKQKNFTRAADVLEMPLSTISRRIQALEKELGVPLFYRSARKVELTESGKAFFERCGFIMAEAEAAWEELARNMKTPAGRVRISVPADIYHVYLRGAFGSFAAQWPGIQLYVNFSQRWVDLLSEPYDLDIRIGPLPDSNLKARKLVTLRPALYASPKLLEFYPAPEKPADLSKLPCIIAHNGVWVMSKGEQTESVSVHPAHVVNSGGIALELALAGLGVTWLVPVIASRYEESGELVPLLPGWTYPSADINIVMASSQVPKRVRLFVEHLVDFFSGASE